MRRLALLCLALVVPGLLCAHPEWKEANCLGVVDESGKLTLTIKFDVPSFLVGQTSKDAPIKALDELMLTPGSLAASIEPGRRRLHEGVRLEVDGRVVPMSLDAFPTAETIAMTSAKQGEADRYPVMLNARLSGTLPEKAAKLRLSFPPTLGTVFVNLRKGMEYQVVMAATASIPAELTLSEPSAPTAAETAWTLFVDGFSHVLPDGWDHCLFMLAMFLGAATWGQALRRSLVFTVGHSITLTAVAMGWLGQPGPWIEPFIALTIGVSAWLAFKGKPLERSALLLPAAFGLVHGLGFAAAVADNLADWSAGDIVLILIGFNLGV
ncbi:MAG: HupE/UreJ family protein, partial [Opitutales bacterium]